MPAKPDRHNWNELHTYLHIHQTSRSGDGSGDVLSHDLGQFELLQDQARLIGRIVCQHGMFLNVDKQLEIMDRNGRDYVRTTRYNYQAMSIGSEPRPVFRYDNAHSYPRHAHSHHRYGVDYHNWMYIEPPQWIGHENWPLLSEVVDELHRWWHTIGWQTNP